MDRMTWPSMLGVQIRTSCISRNCCVAGAQLRVSLRCETILASASPGVRRIPRDPGRLYLSTTLPRSQPEVMVEALRAVRAVQQDFGKGRHEAPPDGGQARPGWRPGLGWGGCRPGPSRRTARSCGSAQLLSHSACRLNEAAAAAR